MHFSVSAPLPLGEGKGEGNSFTGFLPPHPNGQVQGGEGTMMSVLGLLKKGKEPLTAVAAWVRDKLKMFLKRLGLLK